MRKSNYILVICPNPAIDTYAWLDGMERKTANRITKEEAYPGGKGTHVAMAAAELGHEVKLVGVWGGATGRWVKEACEKRYASLKCYGPEVDGMTRMCYTFRSSTELEDTEMLGVGPRIGKDDFESLVATTDELLANAYCVVMSGSWPQGAPEAAYQQLIELSHRYNKKVILDCTGAQLGKALLAKPYLIHLNKSEALTYSKKLTIEEAASHLLENAEMIAITDGAKGLHLANQSEYIHGVNEAVRVVSTIGSGDCLTAGLAHGLAGNMTIKDLVMNGSACGAANCMHPELGILRLEDVKGLLGEVKVSWLNRVKKVEM